MSEDRIIPPQLWPSKFGEKKVDFWKRIDNLGLHDKVLHFRKVSQLRYEREEKVLHEDALKLAWLDVQEAFPPDKPASKMGVSASLELMEEDKRRKQAEILATPVDFNLREDAIWAYQNAERGEAVDLKTCPGAGAKFLLAMARQSPKDFMTLLAKVSPGGGETRSNSGPTDKIDTLLRQLAEEGEREPEVAQANSGGGSG